MQSLKERDKQVIWHPYSSLRSTLPVLPIIKGEGLYLVDEHNNRYMDAISSWWVTIHGHAHPYIAERVYRQALQLEQVIFAGFTHEPAIELAEALVEILPGKMEKIFYSDNGSTAVEVAVKMALQYWWNISANPEKNKRKKVLSFQHAYHGDTFGAMSISARSVFTKPFEDKLFDVIVIDTPDSSNIQQLLQTINNNKDELAAFIYEPLLQGAGGMRMYDAVLLDQLLAVCKEAGILCIADEVMTGFGRTGKFFASSYMNVKPDIICLSKGITGGTMALGVTACTAQVAAAYDSEDKLKTFFHGHSFTANPIACSASLASLELLKKDTCLTNIELISRYHQLFCDRLTAYTVVKNPRSTGTVLAFEINAGTDGYLNSISSDVTSFMLKKGIYLRPLGNTVYIMPPYCIRGEELEQIYSAICAFIENIQ